jgi:four helix bundle protein
MPFTFENLHVYQKSLELIDRIESIIADLKGKVSFSLLDQLSRAVLSVSLNIAEGSGRWHKREKKQFLRIAKGSIFEIVPILQVVHHKRLLTDIVYQELYGHLGTISKMLSGLEKSVNNLRD